MDFPDFSSIPDAEFFGERIEAQLQTIIRQHALAAEKLTETQLVEVIKQQILSGDIVKHIHYGYSAYGSAQQQSMIYIPYQGVDKLKAENAELKRKLKLVSEALG